VEALDVILEARHGLGAQPFHFGDQAPQVLDRLVPEQLDLSGERLDARDVIPAAPPPVWTERRISAGPPPQTRRRP